VPTEWIKIIKHVNLWETCKKKKTDEFHLPGCNMVMSSKSSTNILEEHRASTFAVKEYAKQESIKKQATRRELWRASSSALKTDTVMSF
jgi:hypothetical protein